MWLPMRLKREAATTYNPRLTLPQTGNQSQVGVRSDLYLFIYDSQQRALNEASLEEQFGKLVGKNFPVPSL